MQFVDPPGVPSSPADAAPAAPFEVQTTPTSTGSDWSLSMLSEEVLAQMESDAINQVAMRKAKPAVAFEPCDPVPPPCTSKELSAGISAPSTSKDPASSVPLASASKVPASGNCSVTPVYFPHPRRIEKRPVAFRSPYIDFAKKRLSVAVRMFMIYMMSCVHMEQEGCPDLQKLKSAFAHSHIFFPSLFFKTC
jgi:hypothetical protein